MLEAERHSISNRRWEPTETDSLRAAIVHRTATIYRQAVTERPEWIGDLLNELDNLGVCREVVSRVCRDLVTRRLLDK
jgi:hypothetical protein